MFEFIQGFLEAYNNNPDYIGKAAGSLRYDDDGNGFQLTENGQLVFVKQTGAVRFFAFDGLIG